MTDIQLTNLLLFGLFVVGVANWLRLRQIARRQEIMMAQFNEFDAAIVRLQKEVAEAIALLQGDKDDQTKIDAAAAALNSVSDGLNAFTPDTPPTGAVSKRR